MSEQWYCGYCDVVHHEGETCAAPNSRIAELEAENDKMRKGILKGVENLDTLRQQVEREVDALEASLQAAMNVIERLQSENAELRYVIQERDRLDRGQ